MLKIKRVGFLPEENGLGFFMEDGSIKAVIVGAKVEKFICSEVLKDPKILVGWEDLEDAWNGSEGRRDSAKFKKRMKDGMSRINKRCGFKLLSWNSEGVYWGKSPE